MVEMRATKAPLDMAVLWLKWNYISYGYGSVVLEMEVTRFPLDMAVLCFCKLLCCFGWKVTEVFLGTIMFCSER
jgi:hypothetical protein